MSGPTRPTSAGRSSPVPTSTTVPPVSSRSKGLVAAGGGDGPVADLGVDGIVHLRLLARSHRGSAAGRHLLGGAAHGGLVEGGVGGPLGGQHEDDVVGASSRPASRPAPAASATSAPTVQAPDSPDTTPWSASRRMPVVARSSPPATNQSKPVDTHGHATGDGHAAVEPGHDRRGAVRAPRPGGRRERTPSRSWPCRARRRSAVAAGTIEHGSR